MIIRMLMIISRTCFFRAPFMSIATFSSRGETRWFNTGSHRWRRSRFESVIPFASKLAVTQAQLSPRVELSGVRRASHSLLSLFRE